MRHMGRMLRAHTHLAFNRQLCGRAACTRCHILLHPALILLHRSRPCETSAPCVRGCAQAKRIVGLTVPVDLIVAAAMARLGIVADLQAVDGAQHPEQHCIKLVTDSMAKALSTRCRRAAPDIHNSAAERPTITFLSEDSATSSRNVMSLVAAAVLYPRLIQHTRSRVAGQPTPRNAHSLLLSVLLQLPQTCERPQAPGAKVSPGRSTSGQRECPVQPAARQQQQKQCKQHISHTLFSGDALGVWQGLRGAVWCTGASQYWLWYRTGSQAGVCHHVNM